MSTLRELEAALDDGAMASNANKIWPEYCYVRACNGVYLYMDEHSPWNREQSVACFHLIPGYDDDDWRIDMPPFGGEGRQWCGSLNPDQDCPEEWSKAWIRQCMKDWQELA